MQLYKSPEKNIISDSMHMPTVIQWNLTLTILTSVALIPFYWCMLALNPMANLQDWLFLIIPTGVICAIIWSLCKYYLDTYVQIDKI